MSVSLINGHIDDDVMTDEQIIKALECCVTYEFCTGCPLVDNCPSSYSLLKSALDLINRQKAEIERLEKDSKRLNKVQMQLDDAMKMYSTIKAEAVKEFAERLKEYINGIIERHEMPMFPFSVAFVSGMETKIDNLVKEMVGEAE